jgi:DNA mismatch repair protein MutL
VARIRRLPQSVASRIAAGEVVERPASVVKELVENSLDAGARRVSVKVKGGGVAEVEVADDGSGIHPEDAEAAFQRYSTSKISTAADLRGIATCGFRGEALAAVAAAAGELEMVTSAGGESAVRVLVRDSKVAKREEIAGPRGTTVSVRRLFAGLPARKKFLKSAKAEAAESLDSVVREALARPDVAFSFDEDGERRLSTPGGGLESAIAAAYGAASARGLLSLDHEDGDVRVSGLISPPHAHRRSSHHVSVSVNGRPVENPELRSAVRDGCRGLLPEGAWPLAVVHLQVPPERVDVNVHPRKLEVKLDAGPEIEATVEAAVRRALGGSVDSLEFRSPKREAGRAAVRGLGLRQTDYAAQASPGPAPFVAMDADAAADAAADALAATPPPRQARLETGTATRARAETREGAVRVVAQLFSTFFVAERAEEVWLVDQHTAHERVLYERLAGKGAPKPQRLVAPAVVELGAAERRTYESCAEELKRIGFRIEAFGAAAFKVSAVPSVLGRPVVASRLKDILDDLAEGSRARDVDGPPERVRKSAACRSAWMKGDDVAPEEFAPVLKELLECRDPYRCPHGRPTVIKLSREWFEREFERR